MDTRVEDQTITALAQTQRGLVVAPAGHGKTEAICRAIKQCSNGKSLVLTHTNAGVAALSARMRKLRVDAGTVEVTTLAKWALRVCQAYPNTAEWSSSCSFDACIAAAARVARSDFFGRVLQASYRDVYVDEYQDCSRAQHTLICEMAKHLPARALGDPLQAIYSFDDQRVGWEVVESHFPQVGELPNPWRWRNNPRMAEALCDIRMRLLEGMPIELSAPLDRLSPGDRKMLWRSCGRSGSALLLGDSTGAYKALGPQYAGLGFSLVEPASMKDLRDMALILDSVQGPELALEVLRLAPKLMSGVSRSTIAPLYTLCEKGKTTSKKFIEQREALLPVIEGEGPKAAAHALSSLTQLGCVYRPGVLWPLLRALRRSSDEAELGIAAATESEITAMRFRKCFLPKRAIASTLLAKGLQADRVVVFAPNRLDTRNFYVAITRGMSSIAVVSDSESLELRG